MRRSSIALGGLVVGATGIGTIDGWVAFGKRPAGDRLERIQASPQWGDGEFENPQPLWTNYWRSFAGFLNRSDVTTPSEPLPVIVGDGSVFDAPPSTGLRITWFGHSSLLIEIDGRTVLTDPVWGPTASPLTWLGPGRWYAPPMALEDLPEVDAVLISHDHYDHLDHPTIEAITGWDTTFVVPLGVGAHLEYWGVAAERIVELDWWDRTTVDDLEIVCTPARHASGRLTPEANRTLWAGYALLGAEHRAYFSGDTGLFPALRDIGEQLGPFDVTMIEAGAYNRAWPDWHLGPEQAVRAHHMVRGDVLFPVHWGLFDLALHGWTEPVERTLVAAEANDTKVAIPRPGASFEPQALAPVDRWWPDLPWQTAKEHPVVSTLVD